MIQVMHAVNHEDQVRWNLVLDEKMQAVARAKLADPFWPMNRGRGPGAYCHWTIHSGDVSVSVHLVNDC